MFKSINSIPNKLLAAGALIAIVIIALFGVDYYQKYQQIAGLSDGELLKADKEEIIDYRIAQDSSSVDGSQSQGIVVYHYVSDQEVPPQTLEGLQEDIDKRTPSAQMFLKSVTPINDKKQKEEYVGKFYSAPTFQKSGDKWYQIETATTTAVSFYRQTELTVLDRAKGFFGQKVLADTFYSGAGDGSVSNLGGDWATVHDSATGISAAPGDTVSYADSSYITLIGDVYRIMRSFLPFDTSAIPGNAAISSAALNVYVTNQFDGDNDGDDYINVVQTSQADSATLAVDDFDNAGAITAPATGAAAVDITGIAVAAYTTFTLNATGLGWIAKYGAASSCGTTAGVTCLGLREGHDIINSAIASPVGKINQIGFSTSEEAGTAQDPYLTVAYTIIAPAKVIIDGGTLKIDGGTLKID